MPLDLNPVYHTETMVQILREQGSTQYALELTEKILQKNPGKESVKKIWNELKDDMRKAFERFRQGGRSTTIEKKNEEDENEIPQEEFPAPSRLNLVQNNNSRLTNSEKIERLRKILNRLQSNRDFSENTTH
jgi:hypothetical protein